MTKAERHKWNLEIVHYHVDYDQVEIEIFSDHHVRITRLVDNIALDFWPSTGRAVWLIPKLKTKTFFIHDFENYLYEKFINYVRPNGSRAPEDRGRHQRVR